MPNTETPTRQLGPKQKRNAKGEAEMVDLMAAIDANDVERATELAAAMTAVTQRVSAVLGRAVVR